MRNQSVDKVRGRTIRWTFKDGPFAGTSYEHMFHHDGTVDWRVLDESNACSAAPEKYAASKVDDDIYAVSYLAASGYTLTVVLNFRNKQVVGFASNNKEWHPLNGTFEAFEPTQDSLRDVS